MTVDRRAFLRLSLGSVCVGVAADCSKPIAHPAFVLEETSIDLVQHAMTDGVLTARSLCEQYLQRVAMLNPTLHALNRNEPGCTISRRRPRSRAARTQYLAARRPRATVRTLADVIEVSKRDGVQLPPLEQAQQKGDISGESYQRALSHIRQISRSDGIDDAVRTHRLDALISPAMGPAWSFAEEEKLDVYPALTLPMGSVNGLPVGILIFGTAWSDAVLLRCAYAYEQATRHRKPPTPRV